MVYEWLLLNRKGENKKKGREGVKNLDTAHLINNQQTFFLITTNQNQPNQTDLKLIKL